jgi:hypothetical protein
VNHHKTLDGMPLQEKGGAFMVSCGDLKTWGMEWREGLSGALQQGGNNDLIDVHLVWLTAPLKTIHKPVRTPVDPKGRVFECVEQALVCAPQIHQYIIATPQFTSFAYYSLNVG